MKRSSTTSINSSNCTPMGFHFGNVLGMLADQYRYLKDSVLEGIQNGLDANAKKIIVTINQHSRNIHITDDGDGASRSRMTSALSEVGLTKKKRGKLGQFGIGVVSPYNKCRQFTFSSKPRDDSNEGRRWVFNCKDLQMGKVNSIPCVEDLEHRTGKIWWTSQLFIEKYNKNMEIKPTELIDDIYKRFNKAMFKHKGKPHETIIILRLTDHKKQQQEKKLRPITYQGKRLKPVIYQGKDCGKVEFQIFIVKSDSKGKRCNGQGVKVVDSTGLFSLPLSVNLFPIEGKPLLLKKDVDLINSGYFEGEILLSDPVKLNTNRRFFNESDSSFDVCQQIEEWLEDHGRKLIEAMDDNEKASRYRDSGNKSLKVIDGLLRDYVRLNTVFNKFEWGSQGKGHTANDAKLDGSFKGNSKRLTTQNNISKDKKDKKSKKTTGREHHHPNKVGGEGGDRIYSRHDSTGLTIYYDTTGNNDLWEFDKKFGRITFNTIHPTWVMLDRSEGTTPNVRERRICQLQENVIKEILIALKTLDDFGLDSNFEEILMLNAHQSALAQGFLIQNADRIASRGNHIRKRKSVKKGIK
jgi:hypothetical protein